MKIKFTFSVATLIALSIGGIYLAQAAPGSFDVSAPQPTIPPNIASEPNKPMMMLASSKDHTLFSPVYTDFEDIDSDGVIDTTFKPTFKYYGYFDSSKCYSYSNEKFEPVTAAIKTADSRYTCHSSESLWSGNFMNWAMMSRIDVVRKMLYGGKRYKDGHLDNQDGISETVLERANLSKDAHSFVKHYWGVDIRDYTPFNTADLIKNSGTNVNVYAGLTICNRSSEMSSDGIPQIRLAKGNYSMWGTINGDVCRWDGEKKQAGTFGPKLARYFLDVEKGNGGIAHERDMPQLNRDGLNFSGNGADLVARVQVCVPGLIGEERCQPFPQDSSKNYKPYGIFQEFGLATSSASARAEFGVITGSYDVNLKAGALRKNMGDFSDEINLETGIFCHSSGSNCPEILRDGRRTTGGAIKAFDAFKLVGREENNYTDSSQQLPVDMRDGALVAWGNPVGEMVVQALSYFAAKASSNPSTASQDNRAGLPLSAWMDPLSRTNLERVAQYGNPICRPMYTLALSSSALSFDSGSNDVFTTLPNKKYSSVAEYVDVIGNAEGVNGTNRSVGSVDGAATFGETCANKLVNKLSEVSGVCPEAPAIGGTYQVAGASLYANTSKIRDVAQLGTLPSDLNTVKDALKVKTLAASLAGGVPRIEVPIPGAINKFVYITPESLWNAGGKRMPGGMLAFKSINSGELPGSNAEKTRSYGSFVVTWNDSLFGGDYDMDVTGFIRFEVTPDPLNPNKYLLKVMTDILNVGAGYVGTHGFSIIGTNRDGRYLTHQHNNQGANGITPIRSAEGNMCNVYTNASPSRCKVSQGSDSIINTDFLHVETFEMIGVDNVTLHDPLWYAAKYGYFDSSQKNADGITFTDLDLPPNTASWDSLNAEGMSGSDGVPDGYFLARRPDILEEQLRKALSVIASASNAASAISSTVLTEGALKYDVSFDSSVVSGLLKAIRLEANGNFSTNALWEAGSLLYSKSAADNGDSREIVTNFGHVAMPFRWGAISSGYKAQMTTLSTNKLSLLNAERTLSYMRGDQSLEGATGLRARGANLLGPIVNSSPWVQQRPLATWGPGVLGYGEFYNDNKGRKKILWVGSNDGVLHAFDTETGSELFGYVPGALANRLAEIPLQRSSRTKVEGLDFVNGMQVVPTGTVWPYVDGNAYTADIKLGSSWRTYLFGSLGRGGRAIYALDVTNPANLKETNANSIYKWQFTAEDDEDLGYQTADVKIHLTSNQANPIARMNNGKFAMIIGNGQRSISGKAALFIIYVDGPSAGGSWSGRYRKIIVDSGSGNGITSPRWEDLDGNGTADVVYAGDLKGNVWKFDLNDEDPAKWKPSFSESSQDRDLDRDQQVAVPLFTAKALIEGREVGLPITTAPELLYMANGGLMVNFGTGNGFSQADFGSSTLTQRAYGIWDRGTALNNPVLQQRTYRRLPGGIVIAGGEVMDWSRFSGWYFDLPGQGEAVLADPSYDAGVLSFVATRPKTVGNECNTMPANSLFMLDPIAGLPERATQGETLVDGVSVMIAAMDIGDPKVRMVSNRRAPPKVACAQGDAGCVCQGNECSKEAPVCGPGQRSLSAIGKGADATICYSASPRLQWREIPGLRTYP